MLYTLGMIEELARRADRAMRTFSARDIAESTYTTVRDALLSAEAGDAETRVLKALATRRGWTRKNDVEFVCSFGNRTSVLNVPRPFQSEQFARLVTRVEVNVFLGATDDALVREFQSLAQRELQRLYDLEKQSS